MTKKELIKNGLKYEKKVFEILKNTGLLIYPLCFGTYEEAPALYESKENKNLFYRAPDFMAWSNNRLFFIEVKSQLPMYYNQVYEFTINDDQYNNYCELRERLNAPFKIVFCDTQNGGFYYADLLKWARSWDGLSPDGKKVRDSCKIWNRDELPQIYEPRKNELKNFL